MNRLILHAIAFCAGLGVHLGLIASPELTYEHKLNHALMHIKNQNFEAAEDLLKTTWQETQYIPREQGLKRKLGLLGLLGECFFDADKGEELQPFLNQFKADISVYNDTPLIPHTVAVAFWSGRIAAFQGNHESAAILFQAGITMLRSGNSWGPMFDLVRYLSHSLNKLGKRQEAIELISEATSAMRVSTGNKLYLGDKLFALAKAFIEVDHHENALELLRESCEVLSRQKSTPAGQVAETRIYLVLTMIKLGLYAEARTQLTRVDEFLQKNRHKLPSGVGELYFRLGEAFAELENLHKAVGCLQESLRWYKELGLAKNLEPLRIKGELGKLYLRQENYQEALLTLSETYEDLRSVGPEKFLYKMQVTMDLGQVLIKIEDFEGGLQKFEEALEWVQLYRGPDLKIIQAMIYEGLAQAQYGLGNIEEALSLFSKILRDKTLISREYSELIYDTATNIGKVYLGKGDKARALSYFLEAKSLLKKAHPPLDPKSQSDLWLNLGLLYAEKGENKAAIAAFEQIEGLVEAYKQPFLSRVAAKAFLQLARLYAAKGEASRAQAHLAKTQEIINDLGLDEDSEFRAQLAELETVHTPKKKKKSKKKKGWTAPAQNESPPAPDQAEPETPEEIDNMLGESPSPAQCFEEEEEEEEDHCPPNLQCPITTELMIEPMVASDGFSYERQAIEAWIAKCEQEGKGIRSPKTNADMAPHLLPNLTLKILIQEYQSQSL